MTGIFAQAEIAATDGATVSKYLSSSLFSLDHSLNSLSFSPGGMVRSELQTTRDSAS